VDDFGRLNPDAPTLEELEVLHTSLCAAEREELLECLLISASMGPQRMMESLEPWLLAVAARRLVDDAET
jgi:hypothetical protein